MNIARLANMRELLAVWTNPDPASSRSSRVAIAVSF
jgi:hypothetical protein